MWATDASLARRARRADRSSDTQQRPTPVHVPLRHAAIESSGVSWRGAVSEASLQAAMTSEERASASRTSGRRWRDMKTLDCGRVRRGRNSSRNRRVAVERVNSHFTTRILPFVSVGFDNPLEWKSLRFSHLGSSHISESSYAPGTRSRRSRVGPSCALSFNINARTSSSPIRRRATQ